MRPIEPAYPSFTLVINKADDPSALRLPAYRSSHQGRYHPYPRAAPHYLDHLMQTVDYRDDDELPSARQPLDVDILNDEERNLGLALRYDNGGKLRRRLSALVVDLALAIRRQCDVVRMVKTTPAKFAKS